MKLNSLNFNSTNAETILNQLDEIVLILNREREIIFYNNALNKLPIELPKKIIGKRPGEIFGCIHVHKKNIRCGTTDFCKRCGANQAIQKSQSNQATLKECLITSMTSSKCKIYNFKVNSSPITVNEESMTLFILSDIGVVKKGKILEETLYALFQNMSSGVAIYEEINDGEDFIFQYFNKAAEKIDKQNKDLVLGKKLTEVFPGSIKMGMLDALRQVYKTGTALNFPLKFYTDNRISGWRDNYIFKLPMGEVVAIYTDVTEQKKKEEALKELSLTDRLTGLKNKRALDHDLDLAVKFANVHQVPISTIMIDIDYFKNYNDLYGHIEGDKCLKHVTRIAKEQITNELDDIYRFGGEEFVIILNKSTHKEAMNVAEKIRHAIESEKIPHEDSIASKYVTASLGIGTKLAKEKVTAERLLNKADKQMYLAKYSGRNTIK